jgi:hypothetical protein
MAATLLPPAIVDLAAHLVQITAGFVGIMITAWYVAAFVRPADLAPLRLGALPSSCSADAEAMYAHAHVRKELLVWCYFWAVAPRRPVRLVH